MAVSDDEKKRDDNVMSERMDRQQIVVGKPQDLEQADREYWSRATVEEKLRTITFLRECFYGREATTGRLQRIHTVFKQT